jgi:THUMP domain
VLADPLKGHVGEHLVRLVPVEDTCGNAAKEVTALAQRISHKHFPASGQPLFFAVRPELHSPRLMDTTVNDLVRRVADAVPPIHRVELSPHKTHKTIVLECVGQNTMMSVVDDWHAMHKYNLRELRKEAQQQAD